jgi:hypothetical protein
MSGENRKYTVIKQPIPDWFNGTIYKDGDVVRNRFTGEEYKLNNVELSMYDFVIGASMCYEMGIFSTSQDIKDLRKGLDWFRKHNPEAYMVLLD